MFLLCAHSVRCFMLEASAAGTEIVKPSVPVPFHIALSEPGAARHRGVIRYPRERHAVRCGQIVQTAFKIRNGMSALRVAHADIDRNGLAYAAIRAGERAGGHPAAAVNTPSAFTAPTSPDTLHLNQEPQRPSYDRGDTPSASTLMLWPGLTEIELSALPLLCSAIESTPVVIHTFIEPETAPFEPVMVARPGLAACGEGLAGDCAQLIIHRVAEVGRVRPPRRKTHLHP